MIIILILLLSLTAAWAQNPNTAAFPTTIATDQNLGAAKRISNSTLSASINSSTLTVNVASGAQFLQYEIIRIDSEEMMICSIASNTLTICTGARGYNGTTAASHTSGSTVYGVITSWHHNQMAAEIKAIETRLSTRVAQCQDAGSTDAYACSVAPPITSYTTGLLVNFKANTANTGASTLNLNSLGAIAIKKWSSATLSDTATGDIGAGQWLTVVYDGTYFQIVGGGGGGGSGDVTTTGTNTMTGYTNFSGGTLRFPETTAASLPAAASNTGKIYLITDAVNSAGCTTGTGGGSQRILCTSNGTYWIPAVFTPNTQTAKGIITDCTAAGGYCNIYLDPGKMGIEDFCSASSSSPTTYACSTSSTYAAYTNGALAVFDVGGTACTGSTATTLNINSIGAKRIYRYDGTSDPESADCAANSNLLLVYDSSLTGGAGGWRIIGGTPGSAGGGTAVNPYTTTFSSVSSVSVAAATHGQGTKPLVACFDNATPRHEFACDVSVAANGDVVATFTASVSGTLEIYGGGGSGDVRTDSNNTYTSGVNDFSSVTLRVPSSTTLPATCAVGDSYMDTDATSGQRWYLCESTDTWVQQGGSGGATAVTATSTFGTDNAVLRADGTGRGSQASSCAIDDSGALTCPSIAATGGGVGILTLTEGTAPGAGASAGQVNIYVDSSTHRLGFHINGGSADKMLQSSSPAADFPALNQNTTGNAATATALAANGTNCSAGQFPLGVDASGSSESCTALPTTISGTSNEITASASTGAITLSLPATIDLGGKTSLEIPNGAAPTVNVFGQIAGDNDLWAAGRGAPVFYDGTAAVALVGVLVSDAPSNGQVPTWNTGGTITWETPSGSGISGLTTNAIVAAGSSTTVATPSTTSTLDSSGNAVFAGTVTATDHLVGTLSTSSKYTAVPFSATPTFTVTSTNSNSWYMQLTGDVTSSTLSGSAAGQLYAFRICQDATGGHSFAWPTGFTGALPVSTAANACTDSMYFWDGTNAILTGGTWDGAASQLAETAAPSGNPPSGFIFTWPDSTDHIVKEKDSSGNISSRVRPSSAVANQFLTGLGSNGLLTRAQPSVADLSGLGTGMGTWLGTPSSANLASAITDETGSGSLAFATQPSLTRPLIVSTTFASLPAAGTADRAVVVTDCANTSCSSGGGSTVRLLRDTGAAWAVLGDGDSGGSPAFSSITAGTNTAALLIGTSGSLGTTGSGTITATAVGSVAAANVVSAASNYTSGHLIQAAASDKTTADGGFAVSAIARNDTSNTFSTGNQDFRTVSALLVRSAAGITLGTDSEIGYDSTAKTFVGRANAATVTFVAAPTSTTATQAMFATTTAGAPAFRAIAATDLPGTLSSGTAITNASLTTPSLGVAAATSINKVAITAPATSATLTIANGKTLTASNTLTFTGTDSSSVAFGAGGTVGYTIASGTSALGTSAISSGACATVVTTAATGTATTDVIQWVFNADPTSTTGYAPSANGGLHIIAYPTANNVNFKVCNDTASSITPGAVTLNWRVPR